MDLSDFIPINMARCCDHNSEHYPDPGEYSLVGEIDVNYIIYINNIIIL